MRKQLITSVMLATIAGMIGLAVVENQAVNAIEQNAGQASNQQQQQNVGQAEFRWQLHKAVAVAAVAAVVLAMTTVVATTKTTSSRATTTNKNRRASKS